MKAKIVAQDGLGSGVADILALPDASAVALSNYGRNLFLLQDGHVQTVPLAGYARFARRASGISIVDRQFHQGGLLPFGADFRVIFVAVLHLWEGPAAAPHTLEVRNSLAQRDSAPISAAPVPRPRSRTAGSRSRGRWSAGGS